MKGRGKRKIWAPSAEASKLAWMEVATQQLREEVRPDPRPVEVLLSPQGLGGEVGLTITAASYWPMGITVPKVWGLGFRCRRFHRCRT